LIRNHVSCLGQLRAESTMSSSSSASPLTVSRLQIISMHRQNQIGTTR